MADPEGATQEPQIMGDLKGQALLFEAAAIGRSRRLESPVVQADEGEIGRKFGGRPPGARNISSVKRLELFARIGGDPMLASARILAMPTAELAAMLGCDAFKAEQFRQAERALILPYVVSKRPLDINLDTKTPPALHLHFPAAPAQVAGQPVQLGAGGAVALFQAHAERGKVDIFAPDEIIDETEA